MILKKVSGGKGTDFQNVSYEEGKKPDRSPCLPCSIIATFEEKIIFQSKLDNFCSRV
jgi:hypothetical protein